MTLNEITQAGINPALRLLPAQMDSPGARLLMLVIALQESELVHRYQVLNGGAKGPARSFWQFEKGGVRGVVQHAASRYWVNVLCEARGVQFATIAIWTAIETDDVLAAGLARLLIFTDRGALPQLGDVRGAWDLYAKRLWRPGKPHPEVWPANYAKAANFVAGL